MQRSKCLLGELRLKEAEKKQQEETKKQQHDIVTESSLFKGFATKGVRNYNQN